ncbi:MAG: peptidoglycan-binding protein, partial [Clostridia bacterium]|nr:peptidoglycan-binding protein [Clostridia bacterium]
MEKRKDFTKLRLVLVALLGLIFALTPLLTTGSAEAKNIVKGDTTQNIRIVQTRLKELGYYTIKVDGIWGPKTRQAVRNFQRDYGLKVDGIVGKNTEKALKITLNSSSGATNSSLSSSEMNLLAR